MSTAAGGGAELGSQLLGSICSGVDAYYSEQVARHGATPLGVDWSCQATQALRFVQLLKVCDFSTSLTLNDVGCGYGALVPFLAARHPGCEIDYLGIDLSRAMISRARRRFAGPHHRFIVGAKIPRIADYSVASGTMNVNVGYARQTWEGFIATMLRRLHEASRRGFSVNFIHALPDADPDVDVEHDTGATRLYRTTPEVWRGFCESELNCAVEVVDNYGMKEFTLLVRRDGGAPVSALPH
jgi:SAM-dependent methyltransferase